MDLGREFETEFGVVNVSIQVSVMSIPGEIIKFYVAVGVIFKLRVGSKFGNENIIIVRTLNFNIIAKEIRWNLI